MGWADNRFIAFGNSCEVKGCNTMTVRADRIQPHTMMAIQITTNRKEEQTSSACTAAIDVSKQSKILSSRPGLWYRLNTQRICLPLQTMKNIISQKTHSNLGWRNASKPSRTFAAIPRARGALPPAKQDRATESRNQQLQHVTHI